MQKKPELKQIDFIVYPFINAGIELATKSGKRKYDQGMKRI